MQTSYPPQLREKSSVFYKFTIRYSDIVSKKEQRDLN